MEANPTGVQGAGVARQAPAASGSDEHDLRVTSETSPETRSPKSRLGRMFDTFSSVELTPFQRLDHTKTAVVLGFVAGLLLSPKLWISTRLYPLVPIVHRLPVIRFPLDYVCAVLLLILLLAVGVASKPRPYIAGFLALLIILAVCDQNRWQPWVYLYSFMLLVLGCFSWNRNDVAGQENTLNICRLILGATYFYSGIQKMNRHFAAVGVISLLGPKAGHLPLLHVWPWIIAGVEACIALGLLTRKYRKVAVICGVLMHLFILFSCIVILHWNSIVWPWNVTMIALLVLLFWNADASFLDVVWRNPMPVHKLAILLFVVLPFFSFFGLWDSYLSASLYSANIPQANILFRGAVIEQLPQPIHRYVKDLPAATTLLNIRDWAMGELNVPPYPAMRAYRIAGAKICKYSQNSPEVVLIMLDRDTWLGPGRQTQDTCLGTLIVDKW
jgi:uncharacterized membrane protein YphA (DoxX/SURF4 family)